MTDIKTFKHPQLGEVRVERQGTVVIEGDDDEGFLMMFPDGTVEGKPTRAAAKRAADRWLKQHARGDISIGMIEWR